jgi:hypothetical protein
MAWHGMAGERHGMCELAFSRFSKGAKNLTPCFHLKSYKNMTFNSAICGGSFTFSRFSSLCPISLSRVTPLTYFSPMIGWAIGWPIERAIHKYRNMNSSLPWQQNAQTKHSNKVTGACSEVKTINL